MTIKEISEKFNISRDTLQYYEKVEIIPPVIRISGSIGN
ncbi:MerR family DNA-binding transcriptional regulator [Leptotrichia sp. OH3620_COT-345]|nr:MerR family DNA-binding transcriptional regulator [Leptotrichia sp. OH3620_COT-345]RRD39478.1 MerR family DNA-binding transcriptional regulator [Leptotrichia sp. OH3620_COT-345]